MWYNIDDRICIIPIDWVDIKTLWSKSDVFWFFPLFATETLAELLRLLNSVIDEYSRSTVKAVILWLFIPVERDETIMRIQDMIWNNRESGKAILWGVYSFPGQKRYMAIMNIMEV